MAAYPIAGDTKNAYLRLVVADRGLDVLTTPTVSISLVAAAVEAAERVIGVALPPAVLLLFSGEDVLGTYDLELDQLAARRDDADDAGVPATLVPLGRDGEEWICVARDAPGRELIVYDAGDESRTAFSFAAWFDDVVARHLQGTELSPEERRASKAWVARATLEVRVEAPKPKKALYRVKHAKFGEGTVHGETGTGDDRKLEIDFGAAGVRVLIARFVTRL